MSAEVETHGQPLHLVSRLYQHLKRRLGLIQTHDQSPQQSSISTKRPRNRLRSTRRPQSSIQPTTTTTTITTTSNGHIKENFQRIRSFSTTRGRGGGTIWAPPWKRPRPPVHPFTLHLPDDVLRTIFELAAVDLDTACSLVLVAYHVRTWVDPVLYSTVRLEGLAAIRLFARTIQQSILHKECSNKCIEGARKPISRITKPPDFFGCVQSLALLPQAERVLLFYRDVARDANLIINSCHGVGELEASGDFLRKIDVSEGTLEPPSTTEGDAESSGGSTEPPVVTTPNYTPNPTTIVAAAAAAAATVPQAQTQLQPQPQSQSQSQGQGGHNDEPALMRPTHLTLVPPTLNVNFRLPILSNVTHLHYASSLPRNLNFLGTLLGLTHLALDYQLGVATARAEALLLLVRTALDWGTPLSDEEEPTTITAGGGGAPDNNDTEEAHSSTRHTEEEDQTMVGVPRSAPRLAMVVVRVLLRPRMEDSDRAGEAWRKLTHLAQTDPRLVYFESQGLFGEDVWNVARERISTSWYRDSIS